MKALWITLNNSTRSKQLSLLLNVPVKIYHIERPAILRHSVALFWAIAVLFRCRPKIIYTQYSFILQCAIYLYRAFFRKTIVIVDFHNKALARQVNLPLIGALHERIKRKTIGIAKIGITTNNKTLHKLNGYLDDTHILPDPLPNIAATGKYDFHAPEKCNITYVSSFAVDEPHQLVYDTAKRMAGTHNFYVTGRLPSNFIRTPSIPDNVFFTNFLADEDYYSLLASSNAIVCLTTEETILQCAIYESLVLNSHVIANDSELNRDTFGDSVLYTTLKPLSLQEAIIKIISAEKTTHIQQFISTHTQQVDHKLAVLKHYLAV